MSDTQPNSLPPPLPPRPPTPPPLPAKSPIQAPVPPPPSGVPLPPPLPQKLQAPPPLPKVPPPSAGLPPLPIPPNPPVTQRLSSPAHSIAPEPVFAPAPVLAKEPAAKPRPVPNPPIRNAALSVPSRLRRGPTTFIIGFIIGCLLLGAGGWWVYQDHLRRNEALHTAQEKARQEETLRLAETQARQEAERKRLEAEQTAKNEIDARTKAEAGAQLSAQAAELAKNQAELAHQKQVIELARKQLELDQAKLQAKTQPPAPAKGMASATIPEPKTVAPIPQSVPALAAEFSPWMGRDLMKEELHKQRDKGYYPLKIEGRQGTLEREWRAILNPFPKGHWESQFVFGYTQAAYEARRDELAAKGFKEIYHQVFTDSYQAVRNQSSWLKKTDSE